MNRLTRGASGFRAKLLVAMMVMVSAVTGLALYFAQRNAEANVEHNLQLEFQSEFGHSLGVQEAHLAAISERCRVLAKSVRIRATLEENDVADLYLNAAVELRDVLENEAGPGRNTYANSLRAKFFRFLNANGEVMSPPREAGAARPEAWESQLAVGGTPEAQQVGYVVRKMDDGREALNEIIVTPIVATDTGEAIGAIVLGFDSVELSRRVSGTIKSGIWLNGGLHLPMLAQAAAAALGEDVAKAIGNRERADSNFVVQVDGVPHLLFYKMLNTGSRFPHAYQVCLFPLADALARQRQLRWRILVAGALLLAVGLATSHFVSVRLSKPVEQLAEDSAENFSQREQAEAALDLTHAELRERNAELQKTLAELKTTQEHVIRQERLGALGQMASGIAHDFNNALVPILGFCELLLLSPAILNDRLKATDYLETIQTAAKDAAGIVARLREFYRSKTDEDAFAPIDLKRLIEQAVTLTRPRWKDQAQASGTTVEIKLDLARTPPVSGEESALRETFTNLIFNAVDAMPGGGMISIRTRTDGDAIVIELSDTGTGMTEEVRRRCLEPFFSTKGERGTGLGLAMVFGIIKRHGGSLDLQSAPGKGTTFILSLPVQRVAPESATAIPARRLPQRPLRVLVVDDEPQVRDMLAATLATEGHEVELASHGADGLDRFRAGRFDLVVTDKAMPVMNGEQMANAIKQITPNMPIILLTGFGQFMDKENLPDIDVLTNKPVSIPVLRDAIATAMEAA